jgi:uncharacterized protein (TIGR02147 family)
MAAFDYHSYKRCVNDWIESQPRGGHGQLRKLALHLGVNSVVMSQVFRGDRDLSLEQALGTAVFMGLTDLERDYFLLLVQKDRAGTIDLKEVFEQQLAQIRISAQALKNRIKHQKFTDEDRATFYSQWYYSAIRLGVSIPQLRSVSALAERLKLDRSLIAKTIEFLLKHRLIVETDGVLDMGPKVTHIGHDSPFVNRHHTNWRLQGLQAMERADDVDMFYTGPMALSEDAALSIKKMILEFIEKSTKQASKSDSEVLRCLNIDWFEVGRENR